ncbi:MAG: 23S rRNA (adenine(2503)-C(2))-methyltransferase RlmN [Candidatus Omnitrophica bacterium]|nr:23S rRNA (adenine(2503)-C(2))-methyltransferase RlmN [Candidatus Omnitrophota bacterium]
MEDIKKLTLHELESILTNWQQPKYHARQIFSWIYKKFIIDFDLMSDLPIALRQKLKENFFITSIKLEKQQCAKDGTEKFLLKLADNNFIEAVIIPAKGRVTACISSQVGCKFACSFCASGIKGFKRNLTHLEIIEQLLLLKNKFSGGVITHIVFMGTGEPLDNYDFVLKAIRLINSKDVFNIGARRITISTCGIIPGIKRLEDEDLQIELSISLHSADENMRQKIVPVDRKYPLKELIRTCKEYIKATGRQITFEYILISGLNSSLQDAQKLVRILSGLRLAKVNLIPANPVKELNIAPPGKLEILLFQDTLKKAGIPVTLRRQRGQDIDASCGQLRLKYEK